ncbi:AsmA-like C-terminal domain-containing protein [Sulfuricurvum sp.]|uniref:YhdP family protein n=1 Tax=Sulfuricurvum sp. TaxID=2025608 RepID=UPI003BB1A540
MKETVIANIIPKTHRYILLGLFFTFLFVFFTFVALLEGIKIDHLTFKGLIIEKLYLKWEDSLLIKASKIDISALKTDNLPLTLKPLGKLPPFVRQIERWTKQIDIDTIQYQSVTASLHYHRNEPGRIRIQDGNDSCDGSFTLNENLFHLNLPDCRMKKALFSVNMTIQLKEERLSASVVMNLPDTPALRLKAYGDTDTLSFIVHSDQNITSVKPIVEFFGVDPDVQPWINDYAQASYLSLHRLEGKFHYDKPEELLETLLAEATVVDARYTFAQGFEPISAPRVELLFLKGKLHITPVEGVFYSLRTEQSRLAIDFTTPNTMLDIHIQTAHAMLNDPILALLRFYNINIPIKQTLGTTDVNLDLSVNLHSLDTTAQGTFRPSPSELSLDKIPLRSEGGVVTLSNARVSFDNFTAHYGIDKAHARVRGEYDASSGHGIVSIDAFVLSPIAEKKYLQLAPKETLRIAYIIAPQGDTLSVMPSVWNVLGEKLRIEAFRAPFDYHNASCTLKSVPFNLSDTIHGKINGVFSGAKQQTDMNIQLDDFKLGEVQLHNAPFNVDLHYDDNRSTLQSSDASAWSVHQLPVLISPFNAVMQRDDVSFENIEILLGDLLKGKFTGHFSLDTFKGSIRLANMVPLSPKISPLVDAQESLLLNVDASGKEIVLDAKALKAHFSTIPDGWKIVLDDISLLSKHSPFLRRYDINKGTLNLFYTPDNSRYTFNGTLQYPYALMMINDVAVSGYHFRGTYQDGNTNIRVNNRLVIDRKDDKIEVNAKNIGINVPQLFKFLSAHQPSPDAPSSENTGVFPIKIHASNTYLYLMKNRKIVADQMEASLVDNDLDASLSHMGGNAALKIRSGLFYINGSGFNDKFMEHLFALSDFSGGKFSFEAKGEADVFDGIMRVENTILKDYKLLNNVLAFVNTVPSLATFSLPNYNTKGLPVKEGYAHFTYDKGILNVDNFTLESPEIKIRGEGRADMKKETLNGALTLKTDLGSALGKVPLVGYILFGNDGSISTTVTLSGKLDDPKVETAIAQEIVTAPFNILKRTLVYPFLWMIPDDTKKKQ